MPAASPHHTARARCSCCKRPAGPYLSGVGVVLLKSQKRVRMGAGLRHYRRPCATDGPLSSAPLRDLLDAPTALAACCRFDLCHKYTYSYFVCPLGVLVVTMCVTRRTRLGYNLRFAAHDR